MSPTNRPHFLSLMRNSLYASGGWILAAIVGFATTPYLVYRLTTEGYGAYILLTSLAGYYGILDLGLGQGIVKFVAEYEAKKEWNAIGACINAALVFQCAAGILGSALIVVNADAILHLFKITGALLLPARMSIYIAAGTFLVTMLAATLNSVLAGLQLYGVVSALGNGSIVATAILSVVALMSGGGLLACVVISAVASIVLLCLTIWKVRVAIPSWEFSVRIQWGIFRSILVFSAYMIVVKIADTFNNFVGRFVVGVLLGPVAVAFYMVPSKVTNTGWGVLGSGIGVILPFASKVHASEDHEFARKLCIRSSAVFAAIALPLFCAIMLLSPWLLRVWMGESFARQSQNVLSLLGVSGMAASVTSVPVQLALGFGRSKTIAFFGLGTVFAYICALVWLVPVYGVDGAAFALVLATIPGFGLVATIVRGYLKLPLSKYSWDVYGWHLPAIALALLLFAVRTFTYMLTPALDLALSVLLILIYGIIVLRKGVLPLQDIKHILKRDRETIKTAEDQ